METRVFLFNFVMSSQTCNHSQTDFSQMFLCTICKKVEKVRNFCFYVGYMLEIVVEIWWFKLVFLEIWANLGNFFHKNPLCVCVCLNHIFQVKKCKTIPHKTNGNEWFLKKRKHLDLKDLAKVWINVICEI